jgi:hypothetical protein
MSKRHYKVDVEEVKRVYVGTWIVIFSFFIGLFLVGQCSQPNPPKQTPNPEVNPSLHDYHGLVNPKVPPTAPDPDEDEELFDNGKRV